MKELISILWPLLIGTLAPPTDWTKHVSEGLRLEVHAPPAWSFTNDPAKRNGKPEANRDAIRLMTDPNDIDKTGTLAIAALVQHVDPKDVESVVDDFIADNRKRAASTKSITKESEIRIAGERVKIIEFDFSVPSVRDMKVHMLAGAFVHAGRRYTIVFATPTDRFKTEQADVMKVLESIKFSS